MQCEVTLQIGDKREILTGDHLDRYADSIGLSAVAKGRCSRVFTADIYVHERFGAVEPWVIVQEIAALESGKSVRGTKPAMKFEKEPLRGLWHKHYFCARFVARNIVNQLARGRGKAIIDLVLHPQSPTIVTDEMITELARRLTVEHIEERERLDKLTGEWIVFAKHDGKNYYLCLATHPAGDQVLGDQLIFNRLVSACLPEFPFLSDIIHAPLHDEVL